MDQVTTAQPALLEVREASRVFGGFTAVESVSLDVFPGEILGIAGPNGAGKSTLFNLITGVPYGPSRGTVTFENKRIDHLKADRISRLGLRRTFQAEQLFSTLTVEDNVAVSAAYLGKGKPRTLSVRQETERVLETVGISSYARAISSEIPLLVKKKLMIASSLVGDPRLLMLDEPAGGLDVEDQEDLIALLTQLQKGGLTILIIEHVLSLLRALAGRMIVMAAGEVLATGTPEDVLRDPAVVEAYMGRAS